MWVARRSVLRDSALVSAVRQGLISELGNASHVIAQDP